MSKEINLTTLRTRWAALGAVIAITLGAGGIGIVRATSPAGAAAFVPITPCRITDTRPGNDNVGPRHTPIGQGENYTIAARGPHGNCNLPTAATGISVNITAVNATAQTNPRVYPTGASLPATSNLNPSPANFRTVNAATTKLSSTGRFDVRNFRGSVDVIIDINGYYTGHDHDDRYDTSAQVDAKIATATADREQRLNGESRCNAVDFFPASSSSTYSGGVNRIASSNVYCGLDLPVGGTITGFRAAVMDQSNTYDSFCKVVSIGDTAGSATVVSGTEVVSVTKPTVDVPTIVTATPTPTVVVTDASYFISCSTGTDLYIRSATVSYDFAQ